jgi:hypothetical protein
MGLGILRLVEDRAEKLLAQATLERRIREKLTSQGERNIGFPAGNVDEVVYAGKPGELWAAFSSLDSAKVPRLWNAFGVYDPKLHAQVITVEINIPTTTNSAQIAGFFARDSHTDRLYLLHDGSVGGGKPGVGRQAFLASSKASLQDVTRTDGYVRPGVVIGAVEFDDFVPRLWRFVQQVQAFKAAVRTGMLESPEAVEGRLSITFPITAKWFNGSTRSAQRFSGPTNMS